MGISPYQYRDMLARTERNRPSHDSLRTLSDEPEKGLHADIKAWCDKRWPRVKYIHSRTDRKATIGVGVQDLTLFLPGGNTLCIECKSKSGKRTKEQLSWSAEMRMIGHEVYVVRSMDDFHELIKNRLHSEPVQ